MVFYGFLESSENPYGFPWFLHGSQAAGLAVTQRLIARCESHGFEPAGGQDTQAGRSGRGEPLYRALYRALYRPLYKALYRAIELYIELYVELYTELYIELYIKLYIELYIEL